MNETFLVELEAARAQGPVAFVFWACEFAERMRAAAHEAQGLGEVYLAEGDDTVWLAWERTHGIAMRLRAESVHVAEALQELQAEGASK